MKVLYFDCFSGISGDMTLGALIDLGVDKELFKSELDKLNLSGYDIVIGNKSKNGIIGTDVDVIINEEYEKLQERLKRHEEHQHLHKHGHPHEHSHEHGHHHKHGHSEDSHQHSHSARNLKSIETMIDWSDLNQNVKDFSKRVFREIAKAEAKVHNKDINEVHFHEVGAIDSIVDIVGAAICLDLLGIQRVHSSPLHDGHGFIECQHGIIPVPVPAVMEMLKNSDIPLVSEDVNTELVTPTGMGIIKCLSSGFGNMPAMTVEKVGYGMGKRETGRFNALRVVMGTLVENKGSSDEITLLETNIDDMTPEALGYTAEALLEAGALDVFITPVYMKKSRPASILSVLVNEEKEEKFVDIILRETSTLGIRKSSVKRYCMDREMIEVETQYGKARVKIASGYGIRKAAPEYEDCKEIAKRTGLPLREVYELVMEKAGKHVI
ncbi:MAG: nickel pincer cofactor biosynthesis protein LarC [Clostridia bacterium]|nr:nickel pincer cofactor biosynthesis protein LarC [Clostridia bacterium]